MEAIDDGPVIERKRVLKLRWLWLCWGGDRDYGSRPGRTFGFILLPRPNDAPGEPHTGLLRVDGYVSLTGIGLMATIGRRSRRLLGWPSMV